jgi:signal transduction histidine kinase
MKDPAGNTNDMGELLQSRSTASRYIFAVVVTAVAFGLRLALDSHFQHSSNKHIFTGVIVAIILSAWYGGFIPSVISGAAGFLLADWFFLDPKMSFRVDSSLYLGTVIPPILIGLTIILFGRSLHLAREKAVANAREAIAHQKKLEVEVKDRIRAEEEVRRLNEELEHRVESRTAELVASNQELESFTYSVSHDLRAPLRHVDGYAQILEEEFGPKIAPEAQKFVRKIRQGSQNMGHLVDDLLNLSRVGKKELLRQNTDLNTIVESAVAESKLEAPNRQIEWRVGQLSSVLCDAGLINQVFINLISNAIKYSRPRERAVIEIGQIKLNEEPAFFVRDNGVGFNMKYSGKLFGVFQRLHRTEEFEGTGVGLATVARIIRKHGGRIWAEAELDKGAAFFFTLPSSGVGAATPMESQTESVAS